MRVRMLQDVASAYGTHRAGTVADIPSAVAASWCKHRIAIPAGKSQDAPEDKSEVAPEDKSLGAAKETKGTYQCSRCRIVHREDSKIGRRHLKYR